MSSEAPGRDAPSSSSPSTGSASHIPLNRWAHVVILCSIVLVNLIQQPGYTTFDTKLDLTENPGGFMRDALSVWNPDVNMGSLQNQAYGYLFPVAPFFWLGDTIGIPMWMWQRVWSALILVVAYEGMRRLARATGGLGPGAAVVAGLSFALAPRMLSTVGVLTGETLPSAILPWTVLPLVHAWHRRQGWGRAVLLSAATLPFMAGLNATEVLCTLPLPGLVILCSPQSWRHRIRWGAIWSGLVLLACSWWLVPLMVLGRYAPPFLDYIESGKVTTSPIGWLGVLRGATHWLTYLGADDSHWIAGHELTYQPLLVVAATVISIVGLLGLTIRRTPLRRPFLLATGLAMIFMALGHGGIGGSVLGDAMQSFLDGPGAPFRNIHKFDPVVRAGIAIGLAWSVTWAVQHLRSSAVGRHAGTRVSGTTRLPALIAVLAISLLGLPALQGDLRADDGWKDFPQPWREMQRTLQKLPAGSRVMVLPGPGNADQTWGRTVDEPIQTMNGVSWASRSQIPLVSPGGLRLLESIEERVGTGRPSKELAPLLAQAGFSHVLVRNDLDATRTEVPSTARLHATLQSSDGFRPAASYGVGGDGSYPMVELYSLTGAVPRARAVDASGLRELAGESDQLIPLGEAKVLAPDELTVGRGSGLPVSSRILTEGAEKRERSFGRVHDAITSVHTPSQPWEEDRAAHDYGAIDTKKLTTVDYGPVDSITSSSTADSTLTGTAVRRDQSTWAAFDRSMSTDFVTAPYTKAQGQWIGLKLKKAQRIGDISIALGKQGADVSSIRVTTDRGHRDVRVPRDGKVKIGDLGGKTERVRVTVKGVRAGDGGQVHMSDIRFEDLKPTRTEVVHAPANSTTTMSFRSWPGRSECITGPLGVHCEPPSTMGVEEAGGMARQVRVTESGKWKVRGQVRVTGGRVVDDLLRPLDDGVAASASSTYAVEALSSPARAVDGDNLTGWTSGVNDTSPWLDLSWKKKRKLSRIELSNAEKVPGKPARILGAAVDGKPVKLRRSGDGYRLVKPVSGKSLRITLHPTTEEGRISVGEVRVKGLEGLTYRPKDSYKTGLPCGFGPPITVSGKKVDTKVTGTIGDINKGRAMEVESCSGDVELKKGTHRVSIDPVEGFAPTGLTLTPDGLRKPVVQDVPLAISQWSSEERKISIGGTDETVLTVPENINDGWVARLGDKKLSAITVDGWKQGFVVPAGSNREVELSYAPATTYRAALIVGGLAALGVLAAAVAALLRGGYHLRPSRAAPSRTGGIHHAHQVRRTLVGGAAIALGLAVFAGMAPALGFAGAAWLRTGWRRWAREGAFIVATAAAVWWAVSPTSDLARSVVDVLTGLVVGLAFGLAFGPLPHRRKGKHD